ncbi:hypothetical protein [Iningainema tapete]|uniref:Uncharacterized protein n=1 Tax=Iningainema tapete BLCC-T55 TaxID=2748662 RepID=A0A8J6XLV5_9CYAN|nr:hypothetical protein [Iningainema tapete]MBD2775226.1 hypothetical protein [Iningainema tapete BLCC-T55]
MNNCPTCDTVLLRHVRETGVYWFCRSCWQEMPVLSCKKSNFLPEDLTGELPKGLSRQHKTHLTVSLSRAKSS